ncbi:MAG: acyl-CoA dehydrogenase family protein [Actinomycetota bacterium]
MLLSPEQTRIREVARAFARAEIAPHAAEWDRTGAVPTSAILA